MRRVRYSVAMSLDGYIAGPKGGYDWIVMDPDIDFGALFKDFDTVLMGRKVTELEQKKGKDIWLFGGGELFRSLLGLGLVDAVEVAIVPVLLGGGVPMLPSP